MSSTVFISYSRTDTAVANQIASLLNKLGIKYFLDVKDINWGGSINATVRAALLECHAVLVVLSPGSLKSQWVPYEIGHASALRKTILPYLTHTSLELPLFLQDRHYLTTLEGIRDYFESLDLESEVTVARGPLQSVIDGVSKTQCKVLTGEWLGNAHQMVGHHGKPLDFPFRVALSTRDDIIYGSLVFTFLVDGEVQRFDFDVRGGMVDDRFIWLNYYPAPGGQSSVSFGTIIGELQDNDTTLIGVYSGYGAFTKSLVTGYAQAEKAT
jgi:hypothetical protein